MTDHPLKLLTNTLAQSTQHRIPISGTNWQDIERAVERVDTCCDLYASAVHGTLKPVCQNLPMDRAQRLNRALTEFIMGLADLNSDLLGAIEAAGE